METRTEHRRGKKQREEIRRRNKTKGELDFFFPSQVVLSSSLLTCKQPPEPRLERVQGGSRRQEDRPLVYDAEDRVEVGLACGGAVVLLALGHRGDTPTKLGLSRHRRRRRRRCRFRRHHPSSSGRDAPRTERPRHATRGQLRRARCCSGLD